MTSGTPFNLLGAGALLLLAGCAGVEPVTEGTRQVPTSGGAAGAMGPGYCQSPPRDPTRQQQWDDLCFPNTGHSW